jgi:hypothetical protein
MDKQLGHLADALSSAFAPDGGQAKQVHAAIALALDFWTWRRLAEEGIPDDVAASVMVGAVRASALDTAKPGRGVAVGTTSEPHFSTN